MNNRGAIIRLYSSALCIALFLTYISAKGLSTQGKNSTLKAQLPIVHSVNNLESNSNQNTSSYSEKNPESTNSDSNEKKQSVMISATGDVQGKVIEKFISPYTANTSYDNIYLKNNTTLDINLKDFLNSNLGFKIEKNNAPQVLILHTHATESYLRHNENYYTQNDTARNTNNAYNMVALGKIITNKLNAAGIVTLHDTTQHDNPSYNESYSRAASTICTYLKKYPSIKIVIDLHRDALAENDNDKVKLTTEIDGKKAAQIMLVMGSQSGNVTNFPDWKENLKLAVKLQKTVEDMYPSLARAIHFMPKNYNQSLTTGSLLIEIGTDGNTFEEAQYSAELLSNSLIKLLDTLQ
ncbi:MAG: stage II sporulation protein P [Clostridia bacterium]|nr:stage II sporulation protein P [Clostridia bacterium]